MTSRAAMLAYAAAFGAMLAGGAVFVIATLGTLNSIGLMWVSSALSAVAVLAAMTAVVLARRER